MKQYDIIVINFVACSLIILKRCFMGSVSLSVSRIGKIEPAEVQAALEKLGVNIDLAEAEKLTKRFVWHFCFTFITTNIVHCIFVTAIT